MCQHQVRDVTGHRYCEDHRHGWSEWWAQLRGYVPPSAMAPASRARTAAEIPRARTALDRQVAIAVGEARRIADVTWRYKAEQRVVATIGRELHRRSRADRTFGTCDALAALSTDLGEGKKAALKALERVAGSLLGFLSPPQLARQIAHLFVLDITAVPAAEVDAVVAALRAYGVLLCVLDGRDLQRCRCLRALAVSEIDERIRSEVRDIVGHGLDQLGREATVRVINDPDR